MTNSSISKLTWPARRSYLQRACRRTGDFHCRFLFDAATVMRNSVTRLQAEDYVQVGQHQTEALELADQSAQ